MQRLECKACNSPVPLHAPSLLAGQWQALCGECLSINWLERENANIFLPLRFQVVGIASLRGRMTTRCP